MILKKNAIEVLWKLCINKAYSSLDNKKPYSLIGYRFGYT